MSQRPPFSVRAASPLVAAVIAASLWGCAAELDNPEEYENPFGGGPNAGGGGGAGGLSGAGSSNGGAAGEAIAVCDAPTQVFKVAGEQGGCNGPTCHIPGSTFPPDLISDNPALRLVDVESTGAFCPGELLIDSENIDNSLILKKIAPDPSCGDQMPFNLSPLSDEKAQCIRSWIQSVVAP